MVNSRVIKLVTAEFQNPQFSVGGVTLVARALLNVIFVFVFLLVGWEPEYGGFTSYIAKGEDEEVRCFLYKHFILVHENTFSL